MPILFMALLALLTFIVMGILCLLAVLAESRQLRRNAESVGETAPKPKVAAGGAH